MVTLEELLKDVDSSKKMRLTLVLYDISDNIKKSDSYKGLLIKNKQLEKLLGEFQFKAVSGTINDVNDTILSYNRFVTEYLECRQHMINHLIGYGQKTEKSIKDIQFAEQIYEMSRQGNITRNRIGFIRPVYV